jgi:hypothetical protein
MSQAVMYGSIVRVGCGHCAWPAHLPCRSVHDGWRTRAAHAASKGSEYGDPNRELTWEKENNDYAVHQCDPEDANMAIRRPDASATRLEAN